MKKVMMLVVMMVCVMMLGACGSSDGFVKTGYYQDELINTGEHKPLKRNKDEVMLDEDRGVYAIGQMKDGKLVYTVYYGYITVDELEFDRKYRKADDQTQVTIVRRDGSEDKVCYKGKDLFRNVLVTELDRYR